VSSLLIRADDTVGRSLLYGCLTRLFQRSERERGRERDRCVSQRHSLPLTRIAHAHRYLNRSSIIRGSSFVRTWGNCSQQIHPNEQLIRLLAMRHRMRNTSQLGMPRLSMRLRPQSTLPPTAVGRGFPSRGITLHRRRIMGLVHHRIQTAS
jgi:hypothetical protein